MVESCSSGKKAYERGNYDEAVLKAIHRLRKSPNSKKAAQTLRDSYPLTLTWHRDNIQRAKSSTDEFKWERVVTEYQQINYLYNELSRCPACMRIVPNAVSYQGELNEAKRLAADIRYEKGEQILARARENHDRYEAREAFRHFDKVISLLGDYREVRDRIDEAKWLATLKVLVEPIPMHSRNLQISNEFFENKIMEFVETMPVNEFVQFYSYEEAKNIGLKEPDQIIQLQFDDFVLGQVYMKEKEIQLTRDSVVLAVIKAHHQVDMSDALAANIGGNDLLRYQETSPVLESALIWNENSGNDKKVTICHKIPGSLGTTNTITVSQNALQHHLDHGDVQGPCQGQTDPQKKPKKDKKPDQSDSQNDQGNDGSQSQGSDTNQGQGSNGSGDSQDDQGNQGNDSGSSSSGSTDSGTSSTSGNGQHQSSGATSGSGSDQNNNSGSSTNTYGNNGVDQQPDNEPKTQKVYGTVKATMHVFHKSLTSNGLMDFKIIDFHSKRVLTHEKMPGEFVWYTEWGYFNGDERALDDYFKEIVKLREAQPPAPQDLFVAFTQPIYGQITQKIRNFYRNY